MNESHCSWPDTRANRSSERRTAQTGFHSKDVEEPGFEPESGETLPCHPTPAPCSRPTGPHRVVELGHQLRMLEVALTPVHLGALVSEDAGHGDAAPAALWLPLAERSLQA